MYSGIKIIFEKILPDEVKKSMIFVKLSLIVAPMLNFFNDNSLFLTPRLASK